MELSKPQIKEIAEYLDMGMLIFIHKETKEVIPMVDPNVGADMEYWEEDLAKIEANRSQYIRLDRMRSSSAFKIMEDFVTQLENGRTKDSLAVAIDRSKPFRNFNHIIHDCEYREEWFAFKSMKQQEWVEGELENL